MLSFVAAPAVTLMEESGSILFNGGVLMPYRSETILLEYRQDQAAWLYLMISLVALINCILLPKTYSIRTKNFNKFNVSVLVLSVLLTLAFFIEIIAQGGIYNVLAPRYFKESSAAGIYKIFSSSLTLALVFILAVQVKLERSAIKYLGVFIIACVLLILYNPFNASRFRLIQAYLPVLFIAIPSLKRFNVMSFILLFGMVVLMPVLSLTTRHGLGADLSALEIDLTSSLGYLDQHKVLLHLIEIVERDGFRFGTSTLSVLLFFVPRAIWPEKPEFIALVVGNELFNDGFVGTANLSGPIFADFFLDFGVAGVIIGTAITVITFRKIIKNSHSLNGVPVLMYIEMGALPILFRGSVGAVIGLALFTIIFYFSIIFFLRRVRPKRLTSPK